MRILDIGCGNGPQTIELAKHAPGTILAIDNHQPCLDELRRRAEAAGVWSRIRVAARDMHTLTANDGPFDLVWSEGALFVMGFREGVAACHSLLAPGGGLAVSELCWLKARDPVIPPAQIFRRETARGTHPVLLDSDRPSDRDVLTLTEAVEAGRARVTSWPWSIAVSRRSVLKERR